jgi:hypothetical protein
MMNSYTGQALRNDEPAFEQIVQKVKRRWRRP